MDKELRRAVEEATRKALEDSARAALREHPDTALPEEVAEVFHTSPAGLAQMRYRGTGPKYIKVGGGGRGGGRVLYRWSDVYAYLEANTMQRTDDPRGAGVANTMQRTDDPRGAGVP